MERKQYAKQQVEELIGKLDRQPIDGWWMNSSKTRYVAIFDGGEAGVPSGWSEPVAGITHVSVEGAGDITQMWIVVEPLESAEYVAERQRELNELVAAWAESDEEEVGVASALAAEMELNREIEPAVVKLIAEGKWPVLEDVDDFEAFN